METKHYVTIIAMLVLFIVGLFTWGGALGRENVELRQIVKDMKVSLDETEFDNELLQEEMLAVVESHTILKGSEDTQLFLYHTVKKGDWLSKLAKRYYGNAEEWPKIWVVNPEIENPHLIYPGQEIRISYFIRLPSANVT